MSCFRLSRSCRLGALLGLLIATASGASEPHEIGTLGATFAGADWERAELATNLGKDQFTLVGGQSYLIFLESFAVYQNRQDYLTRLENFIAGATTKLEDGIVDPQVDFERTNGVGRATRKFSGIISGVAVNYQAEVISRGDGLGYILVGWTSMETPSTLPQTMEAAIAAFSWPPEDSEWATRTEPTVHRYDFEDWTLSLTYQDSILTPADSHPGTRYSLEGPEGNLGVHLFLDELEGGIDEALDQVIEAAASGSTIEELLRSDLESPLGPARQSFIRIPGDPETDVAIALIELGDDQWIDLRLAVHGGIDQRLTMWDSLVTGLGAEPVEALDAFPIVTEEDPEIPAYLHPSTEAVLQAGDLLFSTAWGSWTERLPTGEFLIRSEDRLLLHPAGEDPLAEPQVLYEGSSAINGTLIRWGGETLLVGSGQEALRIEAGALVPAGFRAERAVTVGDHLLLARRDEIQTSPGIASLREVGATHLILRDLGGAERRVATLPARSILRMAMSGDSALVAITHHGREGSAPEEAREELVQIDLQHGNVREISRWRSLRRLEAAAPGWLVSGRTEAGREGVFHLSPAGQTVQWIQGDAQGVALVDEELILQTDRCLELDSPQCIVRIGIPAVREFGMGYSPFEVVDLDEIATGIGVSGVSLTREQLVDRLEAANTFQRRRGGPPLPSTPEAVDQALADLAYDHQLTTGSRDLLVDLLTARLLELGAEWVPANRATPARFGRSGWEASDPFSIAVHPATLVASTLYDEDGWYLPLRQIGDQRFGRDLLVGPGVPEVLRAMRDRYPPNYDQLVASGKASKLVHFLGERPDNVSLRGYTYRLLAAYDRGQMLAEVAEPFATSETADGVDLAAYFSRAVAASFSPEEAEVLITQIRDAIERQPAAAALYLQLGMAYEQSDRTEKTNLAVACYEKVQDLVSSGSVLDAAVAALERLQSEES